MESIYDGTYTPYGRYLEQKATFDEQQFSLKRGEDGVTETTLAAFCCCSNKSTETFFVLLRTAQAILLPEQYPEEVAR